MLDAFRSGLRDAGLVEGRDVVVDARFAEGPPETLERLAAGLAQTAPRAIVASGSVPTRALARATSTVPIVMAPAGDAVGTGIVRALSSSGTNITGLSLLAGDLTRKRLELLKDGLPHIRRVAIVVNGNMTGTRIEVT